MDLTRRQALAACAGAMTAMAAVSSSPKVNLRRVPEGGIQPLAEVDEHGTLHLVYYRGEAHAGNLFYSRAAGPAIPVNASSGTAIASGTIRGAQMAVGKDGRVHVAWNGSGPKPPMFYTRLNDSGKAFEPQRNLMTQPSNLDGGGSVAADRMGNVFTIWQNGVNEAVRSVYVAKSQDDGHTFAPERKAWNQPTGACSCCGMKIFASRAGNLYALYRSAVQGVHRDIYLLTSTDRAQTFNGRLLHKWDINACPMTSMDIVETADGVVGAWETNGQIFWSKLDAGGAPLAVAGEGNRRKHPRMAVSKTGETILAWTEGTGFNRGGSLVWQVYDRTGEPVNAPGRAPGLPAMSFATPVANADGSFSILY